MKKIIGIVKITKPAFIDPTDKEKKFVKEILSFKNKQIKNISQKEVIADIECRLGLKEKEPAFKELSYKFFRKF